MKKLIQMMMAFLSLSIALFAGQNDGAGIRFDLNSASSGNQNLTSISCPGTSNFVRVDIYVINASNLDSYEFNINYNASEIQFMGGAEDQPVTFESNFLKKNGGSTTGFSCTGSGGVVNCANTLVGNQGDATPDGSGLLASIVFQALVNCPADLSFGTVTWVDNNSVVDLSTDKGANAVLPVELSSFTVQSLGAKISLKWGTKTETNNYGFEIERSGVRSQESGVSGLEWVKIGFVKGNGNSSSPKEYSYTDNNPSGGFKFIYRLKQIDTDGQFTYSAEAEAEIMPVQYELFQNYPNPFNPVTNIKFALPAADKIRIRVFNLLGEEVAEIVNSDFEAGFYNIEFNAEELSSGIYIYRLESGSFVDSKKFVLLK